LSAPVPAVKLNAPKVTVRVHACLPMFLRVRATQRPRTLRPGSAWVNANRTLADSFSVKRKVVPIGGLWTLAM
jgi:hypothetical protein